MVIFYAFALSIILGVAYGIYVCIYFYQYIYCSESIEVRRSKKTRQKLLHDIEKLHRKTNSSSLDP